MEIPFTKQHQDQLDQTISLVKKGWYSLVRQRSLGVFFSGLAVFLSGFLVLWALESIFYLSGIAKTILFSTGLVASLASSWLVNRYLHRPEFKQYYAELSRSSGNEALRNALDLHLESGYKSMFQDVAIAQNLQHLETQNLTDQQKQFESKHPLHQAFRKSSGASGILFLILLIATFAESGGFLRSIQFWKTFQPPNPFNFVVYPGNQIIEQGLGFQARVVFEGDLIPKNVSIGVKTEIESEFRLQQLTKVDDKTFVSEPFSFTNTTSYFIQMDRFRSDTYTVEVQLLPRFEELKLTIQTPSYTGIEQRTQSYPFSVIEAYPGTVINFSGITNKGLQYLRFLRSSIADTTDLKSDQDNSYSWTLTSSGIDTLSFEMKDLNGFTNRNPFQFVISPLVDQYPSIFLIEPSAELTLLEPEIISLGYEYRDDFGFNRLQIRYEIKKAFGNPLEGVLPLSRPVEKDGIAISKFDLAAIGVKPLDQLTYWLEIYDNDAVSGFKKSESQRQRIVLSSMAEYMDIVDEKEKGVQNELQNMDEKYREFEKLMKNFQEDLKTNQLDEFNQKQVLEDLQEKQEEVNEASRQLREQFEQLKNELNQNKVLSPETIKQYEQLQKLIEEIDSPELREALRMMQESLERMDPNELREAMQNLEFNEELYKQRLERTLELFKQVKTNAELDKLARNYEDLARRQQELSKQKPGDQQAKEQESIKNELERSKESLDNVDKEAPKNAQESLDKLKQELKPEIDKAGQKMQELLKNMKGSDPQNQQEGGQSPSSPNQEQQEDLSKQIDQMSARVRQSMSQMNQQQNRVNATALRSILRTLILLSDTQEDITIKTSQQPFRGNGFVELARRENAVNQTFGIAVDSLAAVAARVPQLSNMILEKKTQIQKNLTNAQVYLAERDNANASAETRFVLSGFNELGTLIANLLDQMDSQDNQDGGGGGSMMQQLQEMSGQQQRLNQMIQDMINDIQGERLSQDQMERFNQMARQQNEIRRQLEEMRRNSDIPGGDKIMSELERLAKEMEDAINDIRGGRTDRPFIQRQQNILSRMLDAEKALQERDEDEKRKGNTGDQNLRALPPELTLEELKKRLRSRLSDPSMSRFSDDYQRLIEKYFEELEKIQRQQQR